MRHAAVRGLPRDVLLWGGLAPYLGFALCRARMPLMPLLRCARVGSPLSLAAW